jgi:hypothetical protein
MANKPKNQKPTDDSIAIVDQAIKMATERKEEEISNLREQLSLAPWVYEMAGRVKATIFTEVQARFFKYIFLKKVKESKEYRERFGMTWVEFCDYIGLDWRRVDEKLADLKPYGVEFLTKFADFSGHDLNKIKYLTRAKSADSADFTENSIIYQGEEIPLTPEHKDEIQALLERLEESYKAQIEERAAVIRTKDRLIQSQGDLIHRQERTISKFEKDAASQGLSLEEDAFLKKCEKLKIGFDGYMLSLDPDRMEEILPKNNPTPRMLSAYVAAIKYMKMQICAAHDTTIDTYADPSMLPDESWQPPLDARAPIFSKNRSKAEA